MNSAPEMNQQIAPQASLPDLHRIEMGHADNAGVVKRVLRHFDSLDMSSLRGTDDRIELLAPKVWAKLEQGLRKTIGEPLLSEEINSIEQALETGRAKLAACLRVVGESESESDQLSNRQAKQHLRVETLAMPQKLMERFLALPEAYRWVGFFPRFFTWSLAVFSAGLDGEEGRFDETRLSQFLDESLSFLRSVTDSAFQARQSAITLRLAGPRSDLAYLYDSQQDVSLTEWTALDDQSAPRLDRLLRRLQLDIARESIKTLPLRNLFAAVAEVAPDIPAESYEQAIIDVLQFAQLEVDAENGKPISGLDEALLLPPIQSRYFPNAVRRVDTLIGPEIAEKFAHEMTIRPITVYLSIAAARKTAKYAAGLAIGALASILGPVLGLIFDVIFPLESPTMEDIIKEIKKQVGEGIANHAAFDITQWLGDADSAQQHLVEAIELFKKNPTDYNKGQVTYWRNTFYHDTGKLHRRFFRPDPDLEAYGIYYKTASFCSAVMVIRLAALIGYFKENPTQQVQAEFETFIKDSYFYLTQLMSNAWDRPGSGIREWTSGNGLIGRMSWVKDYVNDRKLSMESGSKSQINNLAIAIDQRARFFVMEATTVGNLCKLHQNIQEISKKYFATKLPSAWDALKEVRASRAKESQKLWKAASGVHAWYSLEKFKYGEPFTYDAMVFIFDKNSSEFVGEISVGFCADLSLLVNPVEVNANGVEVKAPKRFDQIRFQLPYGVRVELTPANKNNSSRKLPVELSDGQDCVVNLKYWKAAHFYFDLEFYFNGLTGLSHFTTHQGFANLPI